MKYMSFLMTIVAAIIAFIATSISQKSSGKVSEFISLELDFPDTAKSAIVDEEIQTYEDLSTPQLLALDNNTIEIIKKATIEEPEKMADWAADMDNKLIRGRVLRLVLATWAENTPITSAMWTETLPAFNDYLKLYETVAASWAQNNPSFAIAWALDLEKKNFRIPTLKAILNVWTKNDPEVAGEWLLFLNKPDIQNSLYPELIHAWFKISPKDTFDWLVKFKGTNDADLDSSFLIKKWVDIKHQNALKWLASEYSTPFIDSLRTTAVNRFTKKNLKVSLMYIKNPELQSIRTLLIHSIITNSAGKDDEKALKALSNLEDNKLKDRICETAALKLVGKDPDALKYVKATGFLTFPKLQDFFSLWGQREGLNAVSWFRNSKSQDFAMPLLKRLIEHYNTNNPSLKFQAENEKEIINYLNTASSLTELLPFDEIPLNIRERFQKLMYDWNDKKKRLFQVAMRQWAATDYDACKKYIIQQEESPYKYLCMQGMLPETKKDDFAIAEKMCEALKNKFYQKNLNASLAIAISAVSPERGFKLLKSNKRLKVNYIYEIINVSPKKSSEELLNALRKYVRKDLHIFMPYYFYKRAKHDPKGAHENLNKFKREIFYEQSLRALAAAYSDFHVNRAEKWFKSLPQEDQIIVKNLLSSTVENL